MTAVPFSLRPFTLLPGAVNELVVGAVWVPAQAYPCPSLARLQKADDLAQDIFDNCFGFLKGPDAPNVDWIEMDREIIAVLSNDEYRSNNAFESYMEKGLGVSDEVDGYYRFEGYKLFQFSGPDVTLADVDDPAKVRLVYQVDVQNGVSNIYNWEPRNPNEVLASTGDFYYEPVLKVAGADKGIRDTFRIKEDQFASGDRRLINHKKYYFTAVAYGYNNYLPFDPNRSGDRGQQTPYIESTRNIGDGKNKFYTVIPRRVNDQQLQAINIVPNPYYGFSQYENSPFENVVKITNLPQKCTVTIYALDGQFIRRFERNEEPLPLGSSPHYADLDWDLKNERGMPIPSGAYLVHIMAPGLGERTLKWFGVQRLD
ncbi:MAG: hypothetical protein R2795_03280 [Saprospiraceae bacterium]